MAVRRVGQQPQVEGRFIQFTIRPDDGEAVHVQVSGRTTNREYGAAAEIPFDSELGSLLAGLHQSDTITQEYSLAGTGRLYSRMAVRPGGNGAFIFSATLNGNDRPLFAYPFLNGSTIEFEVDAHDLPEYVAQALS